MAKTRKEINKSYDEKRKHLRGRYWSVIVYPDDLPENWREAFNGMKWIESPVHDQDVNNDGTRKKAHIHIMFLFGNQTSKKLVEDMIAQRFEVDENGSIAGIAKNPVKVDANYVRYLAHLDNPEKAQYDVNLIVAHGGVDLMKMLKDNRNTIEKNKSLQDIFDIVRNENITELHNLELRLRNNPELYDIAFNQKTLTIDKFINSFRNSSQPKMLVDDDTGEVISQ